ncbi:MAG: ubiquinol oxidase subunit II [Candidatus Paceibacterota bacterium]|jgi:cytochrome o ubiquinol oxidase subunit 2
MKKILSAILGVTIVGMVFYFAQYIGSHNMGVFNPKGVLAIEERNLIVTAICLMLVVVIPVFIMLFSFVWRYRAGNTKAKYMPDWQNNKVLEIIWWGIPAVIITILATITWTSSHTLDPYKPLESNVKPITIEVVALDWKWLFIYPELNIATVNLVEFPVGTPVNFKITADAPMNSFWIPQLAGQIYAMPGMDTKLHVMANEAGEYAGMSSNYSGFGFNGMKFIAKATSQEEFNSWVEQVRLSPVALSQNEYNALSKQSKDNSVAFYSSPDRDLYDNIIMKFMMPASEHRLMAGQAVSEIAMPEMTGM